MPAALNLKTYHSVYTSCKIVIDLQMLVKSKKLNCLYLIYILLRIFFITFKFAQEKLYKLKMYHNEKTDSFMLKHTFLNILQ